MVSTPRRWLPVAAGAAALVLSATALFFSTGLHPIWWLTWLAPVPVLVFAHRARPLPAACVAFGAWLAGGLNMWTYLGRVEVPVGVRLLAVTVPAVVFACAALLGRALAVRGHVVAAALAVPALWVTVEYLQSLLSPHGTFGSIAYSQMDFLDAVQVAAVCGIWGVSFLVLLVPSAVGALLSPHATAGARTQLGALCLALLAVALGYGFARLYMEPNAVALVPVGLAASDIPELPVAADTPEAAHALDAYVTELDALGAGGARFVVLPETVAAVSDADAPRVFDRFASTAARHRMGVVVGFDRKSGDAEFNTAVEFPPDGAPSVYRKRHLVPGLEARYTPGTAVSVSGDAVSSWGVAVCKDMDFPPLGRQYGDAGVPLMLVPAWDFESDAWLHSRMAMMRGVESGFAIARSARQGMLTVSDDRGRVVAERASDSAPVATLLARVPVGGGGTFYARFGDWFAWLCCGLLVGVILLLAVSPRRRADVVASMP